jgi:glycine/D-amino acid oxidase-like deaminating enzyme
MMDTSFDLAVIGAGIVGASTAWYAQKQHPNWKIALFDRSLAGSGATLYSASLDIPFGGTAFKREIACNSRRLYAQMREEVPSLPVADHPFYGFIQKASGDLLLQQCADNDAKMIPGLPCSVAGKYPWLKMPADSAVLSGVTVSRAIRNEMAGLLSGLFASEGLSHLLEGTEIQAVRCTGGLFALETSHGVIYSAERVVQATGPWTRTEGTDNLLMHYHVRVKKIVALHIYHPPAKEDPVFYFFDDEAFLMPRPELGYWLFSFRSDEWDVHPCPSALTIGEGDMAKAIGILEKYSPDLAPCLRGGRVFCDAYTANGDPLIMQAPGYPNYVICGAGSGSGYRLAPGMAAQALSIFR